MDATKTKKHPAFELEIELALVEKNAIRKIRVGANITFERLHKIIQASFCWHESHMYQFLLFKNGEEGEKPTVEIVMNKETAANPKAAKLVHRAKLCGYLNDYKHILYIYDFGDEWVHYIDVVNYVDDTDEKLPALLSGENDAPPEDCGGAEGFVDFLKIIGNPKDDEYKEMHEWAKEQGWEGFDFKRTALNVYLAGNPGRGVWVKEE